MRHFLHLGNYPSLIRFSSISLLAIVLTACGGGSGGGSGTKTPSISSAPVISSQSSSSVEQVSSSSSTVSSQSTESSVSTSIPTSSNSSVVLSSSSSTSSLSSEVSSSTSSGSSQSSSLVISSSVSSESSLSSSSSTSSSVSSESSLSSSSSTSSSVSSESSLSSSSSTSSSVSSVSSSSSQIPAPTVDAGSAGTVVSGAQVNLSGTAAAASGYTIVAYLWEQDDGSNIAVTIDNDDQLDASFTAPYVSSTTLLTFKLTVTDDQARSSTDTVTITVNPDANAPSVYITFPTPGGIYNPTDNSNTLAMFGQVTPKAGSTISKITIKGVVPEVTAAISGQQWRASNLVIPTGISDITLTVEAEDSLGRISHTNLHLSVSESYGPAYSNESDAVLWDEASNKLWVLAGGFLTSDTKIVPVNPRTGVRGSSVLTTALAANDMVFNADKTAFLISGAISNQSGKIHSVNKTTGVVTVLSGAEKGAGEDLYVGSAGLALNGNNLYVAENILNDFSGVMKVDLTTGDREVLLEAVDNTSLTYALADIAYYNNEIIMVKNSWSNSGVYGYNLITHIDRRIDATNSGLGSASKIIVSNGDVLAISQNKLLKRINIATGAVSTISNRLRTSSGASHKLFTYDETNKLFYTVHRYQTVSVIDEVSGHVVDLAGQ